MPSDEGESPTRGQQYRHPDGTTEVVFVVEDGRVLSIREYGSVEAFDRAMETAQFVGVHQGVRELPGPDYFDEIG